MAATSKMQKGSFSHSLVASSAWLGLRVISLEKMGLKLGSCLGWYVKLWTKNQESYANKEESLCTAPRKTVLGWAQL